MSEKNLVGSFLIVSLFGLPALADRNDLVVTCQTYDNSARAVLDLNPEAMTITMDTGTQQAVYQIASSSRSNSYRIGIQFLTAFKKTGDIESEKIKFTLPWIDSYRNVHFTQSALLYKKADDLDSSGSIYFNCDKSYMGPESF